MTESVVSKRWRIIADRGQIELSEAITQARKRHEQVGTLRSGPAIRSIYRAAARTLDAIISKEITDAPHSYVSDDAEVIRAALQSVAAIGKGAIRHHAIWSKAYQGRAKSDIENLCTLLDDRIDLTFLDTCVKLPTPTAPAESPRPSLPASARPTHYKHEAFAHQAAEILRNDRSVTVEAACRMVAPMDPFRKEESVVRAVRSSFDLMYRPSGFPIGIDQD